MRGCDERLEIAARTTGIDFYLHAGEPSRLLPSVLADIMGRTLGHHAAACRLDWTLVRPERGSGPIEAPPTATDAVSKCIHQQEPKYTD